MGCGVPFCHHYCPLHNLIPEWNDLVHDEDWERAIARLPATNNFPEFTGRSAPRRASPPASSSTATRSPSRRSSSRSSTAPSRTARSSPAAGTAPGRVAVVGSGPAGLAAAQQLNRAGHPVTVFERADRLGGLIRYGIPDYKMDKAPRPPARRPRRRGCPLRGGLRGGSRLAGRPARLDVVVLAVGAERPATSTSRAAPRRRAFAMPYLVQQNRRVAGHPVPRAAPLRARAPRRHHRGRRHRRGLPRQRAP